MLFRSLFLLRAQRTNPPVTQRQGCVIIDSEALRIHGADASTRRLLEIHSLSIDQKLVIGDGGVVWVLELLHVLIVASELFQDVARDALGLTNRVLVLLTVRDLDYGVRLRRRSYVVLETPCDLSPVLLEELCANRGSLVL